MSRQPSVDCEFPESLRADIRDFRAARLDFARVQEKVLINQLIAAMAVLAWTVQYLLRQHKSKQACSTHADYEETKMELSKIIRFMLGCAATLYWLTAFAVDGVTDGVIRIGQTVGVTGQIAGPVKEMNEGANAYISFINKRGGVNGRKLEIVTLDDKFDPALTAKNAARLVNEIGVFALFQCRGTPHTEAILQLLAANKVPLVAPSTGAAVFHEPVNPLVFNVRAKYQDEIIKAIEHFSTIGIKSVGLIHVDDSFGRDGLAGFNKAMELRKLKPAVVVKFDRVKPDIKNVVSTVMDAKPHTVIIVSSAPTAVAIITSLREHGSTVQVMTLSNNSSQSFVKSLGKYASGVMVSQITPAPYLLSTKLGQEFKIAAKESGATASYAAMEGFVSAKVLVEGLQRAGRNLTRDSFVKGLESMRKHDLGGVMITYGPDRHTGSEYVELTMINKAGNFLR